MMKRLTVCLMAMLLILGTAVAEPRYPNHKAVVCDDAVVLSASIDSDLTALNRMLDDLRVYVVTVDFLDGESLASYGTGLRERWGLGDKDLLLLMAVGEDRYGFFPGKNWFAQQQLDKLLSVYFAQPFLGQDYNAAVAALMPALAEEVGKVYGRRINLDGMFGVTASASADTWLQRAMEKLERLDGENVRHGDKQDGTGIGFGKVLVTVLLLLVLFGNRKGKRYYHGRRGCFPFVPLLTVFGLWKLWGRK